MSTEMTVEVETVCSLPAHYLSEAATSVTSDGHVVALCSEADGRYRFLWDGETAGEPFVGVQLSDGTFASYVSDDGAHLAYVGERGGQFFVGRDGDEDPLFDDLTLSIPPTFGGGGRHLAYGARVSGGDTRLIVDGEPVETGAVAPIAAVYSRDGERLAYVEKRQEGKAEVEHRIVLDGRPGDWFTGMRNAVGAMQFSPDGRRFAHYEIDGKGQARWVVDGQSQRMFNEPPVLSLARIQRVSVLESPLPAKFSPDSRRFAYFADVVEKGVAIVEDDRPGPLFKEVTEPVFSPDSRHLAYLGHTSTKTVCVVLDGNIIGEWPAVGPSGPVFSPDSRRVAVALYREEGRFRKRHLLSVAVDGHRYPEEAVDDASLRPTFSPDGARVAWWLRQGSETVRVVDGVIHFGEPFVMGELVFDALGRIVHATRIGASFTICVDNRPGPLADEVLVLQPAREAFSHDPAVPTPVPFRLSADGAHVAWAGMFDGVACPVFDDEVGPPSDHIIDCHVDKGGSAVWWAQRGTDVVRIKRH